MAFIVIIAFSSFKKSNKFILSPSKTIIVGTKDYPIGVRFLYNWLNKIYNTKAGDGKHFSILREFSELRSDKDTAGKIVISVGATHFSNDDDVKNLSSYSFIIKKTGNLIVIRGVDDIGTDLGVSYFLDHYCGVRFYLPGDLFTSVPKANFVSIPLKINLEESPFTDNITSTGFGDTGDSTHPHDILQWDYYWALMNGLSRNNWGAFQHTMSKIFYDSAIMKNYPEIYPLINGRRYFPKSPNDQNFEPDFAVSQLRDASVYAAVKYFKSHPNVDYMAFSVMDGGGYSKEGQMGEFLTKYPHTPEGLVRGYTDAYINWLNNLAAKLPAVLLKNGIRQKKTIAYISYSQVRNIPNEKLNLMILPITVYHLSNAIAESIYSPGGALNKWAKVTSQIGNDDWSEGKGFIYPRIYTNILSQFLKKIQNEGLKFSYAHVEAYPNWALDGPKLYEMAHIYWNPSINVDSLRSQFCHDMFGTGAKKMKEYFDTVEKLSTWLNNHSGIPTHMFNYMGQLFLDDRRLFLIQQARQFLDEAAKTKGTTDDERMRIDFFSKGFKISEGFFKLYNLKIVDTAKVNELKDYLKSTVAGNPMMLNIATDNNFVTVMDNLIDQIARSKKQEGNH